MREKKARLLRYLVGFCDEHNSHMIEITNYGTPNQIRRAMTVLGEKTIGTSVDNAINYAVNVWNPKVTKRENRVTGEAFRQLRGAVPMDVLRPLVKEVIDG